ncbi:MAG: methyltransferase domain-containing protein [Vicingaceae bacterium]
MPIPWYKDWFDTEYYHLLYDKRNAREAEQFLDALVAYLSLPKDARIIDIACGKGRHSIYLNKLGYRVTGIDIAARSIEAAKCFENESLTFFRHDSREVFSADSFEVAINLYTSYGYLESREALLDQLINMKNNLVKGGTFVLDYFNSETLLHCTFKEDSIVKGNIEFITSKKIAGHQIVKTIEVKEKGKSEHFAEKVHLISKHEFAVLFEEAGLDIVKYFGDYALGPFREDSSERLIIIARKR